MNDGKMQHDQLKKIKRSNVRQNHANCQLNATRMYEHFNGRVGINLTYHIKKDIQDQLTEGPRASSPAC